MIVVGFHSRSGLCFIIEGGAVDIPRCFGSGLAAAGGNNRANPLYLKVIYKTLKERSMADNIALRA